MDSTQADKVKGAIYGLAYGDAWGWPLEFNSYQSIANNPFTDFPTNAIITDDTQMSLYALEAIQDNYTFFANEDSDEATARLLFGESFIHFMKDPKNNRAPGITCMESLEKLSFSPKISGLEGTNFNSKGCGANMRNPWFGLLPYSDHNIERLSVIQASTTHYHPLALSASALTALVTKSLLQNQIDFTQTTVFQHTRELIETLIHKNEHNPFDAQYLKGLYAIRNFFAANNDKFYDYINTPQPERYDLCEIFGEGKVAEEALLLAIAAVDKYPDDSFTGLKYLVHTSGDSDSIAAIGGAFFGAKNGYHAFNPDWVKNLEPDYANELYETYTWLRTL